MNIHLENAVVVGNELAISFSGEQEVFLPLETVRRACPCAVCQGEPDALGRVYRPSVEYKEASFIISKIEVVGGYALQLFWGDGHSSGMYSFHYLCGIKG